MFKQNIFSSLLELMQQHKQIMCSAGGLNMHRSADRATSTSNLNVSHDSKTNFYAFQAKLQLMKRSWTDSQQPVLLNYSKFVCFFMFFLWRFWLGSDWLLSAAESDDWLLSPLCSFLSFTRRFAESLSDAATVPPCSQASKRTPQSPPTVCVVASEYRRSLSTSSLHTESRLLSLHLMKLLHSISSTLSSWSISVLQIAYGDFIIHTCSSSSLMSTLISVLLHLECHVLVTKKIYHRFVFLFKFLWIA